MILTQAQNSVAGDRHRFRVLNCGRRTGKTKLAVEEIKAFAVLQQANIVYVALTYQQARDIAWADLVKELSGLKPKINESRLEIEVPNRKGTTSKISLRGWESIDTLRGQSFDFIVLDEVAFMKNFWQNWQEVIRPTLTDRKGQALFCSTPAGFNHFYELFNQQNTDDDFKSFHFTTYDNPHIPREEIDSAQKQLTPDRFAQEYLAEFKKVEGLVFKEFDRRFHLFKKPHHAIERIVAVDFGYTNPSAILTIEIDKDQTYYVVDEFYMTNKTNQELIDYMKTIDDINKVYADPAEPDRIEEMRREGFPMREVIKNTKARIDRVRELFKTNKLFIDPKCTNLTWELETLTYAESTEGKNRIEDRFDGEDHACDALGYALFNHAMTKKMATRGAIVSKPTFNR